MKLRALCVDDDERVRRVLARALRRHEFRVHEAATASEALLWLANTDIDLMLADVHMKHTDGYALVETMRASHPEAVAILITGVPSQAPDRALSVGAQALVQKPISPTELVRICHQHLSRRPRIRGVVAAKTPS